MSEQRMIEVLGEEELLLPVLVRDVLTPATEIDQMMAAVRRQLSELTASLRSDLEELRRLVSEPPPMRETSVPVGSSDGAMPRAERPSVKPPRKRVREASDATRGVIDARSAVEFERRFIVDELPAELDRLPFERISEGYVALGEDGVEVRLGRRGQDTTLTVANGLGSTRRREEIALGAEEFQRLWALTEGRRVEKVRYLIVADDGLSIELDGYRDELDGLATAAVRFDSEARADAFEPPPWFGPEVTDDPRYSDARLACDGAPPPPRTEAEPFGLYRREGATSGIRRIVCGQIDAAIDDLGAGTLENPGEAVHACRKRFKRVRATARLVRDELGTEAYRRENAAFRDLGRRLSHARDSQVLLETLDALCARYAPEVAAGTFVRLRAALLEGHQTAERNLRENPTAVAPIILELRAARTRVAAWHFEHDTMSGFAPAFERIYRQSRRAFLAAREDPTDESLHELRKRSKDLWHAAQILGSAAPKRMRTLAAQAHRLCDLVGDDHDLAVLSGQAAQQRDGVLDGREAALLQALIARRRRQIQREAIELAQRIFAAKPHKFAGPIRHARAETPTRAASPASAAGPAS